jgi:hypothetical protein
MSALLYAISEKVPSEHRGGGDGFGEISNMFG